MTPRVTRALTAAVLGTLTLAATAAWACEGNKSAKATACAPGSKATVTAGKAVPAKQARVATTAKKQAPAAARKAAVAPAAAKAAPAEAGMRVYLDPETGSITSLPEAMAIGPDGIPGDVAVVLVETPLPGRGFTMDLQGTMQEYSVLHLDANGGRHLSCSKDPRTALKRVPAPSSLAFPEK